MKYLKQFLCGANILTVLPFYLAVNYSKDKTYSYFNCSFMVWNMECIIIYYCTKV